MDNVIKSLEAQGFSTGPALVPIAENANNGKASASRIAPLAPGSRGRHHWGLKDYKLIFPSLFNNKFFSVNKLYNATVGKAFKFINGDLFSNAPDEESHVPFQSAPRLEPIARDDNPHTIQPALVQPILPEDDRPAETAPQASSGFGSSREDDGVVPPADNDNYVANFIYGNVGHNNKEGGIDISSAKVVPITTDEEGPLSRGYTAPDVVITAADLFFNERPFTPYKHKWAITLEKDGKYSIDNPYASPISGYHNGSLVLKNHILPAFSFRFSTYKSEFTDIPLPDFTLQVPGGYSRTPALNISVFNDNTDAIRRYVRQYKESVIPGRKTVRPYKESCSKLCIYIYEPTYNQIYKYSFAVIPDLNDLDISDRAENNIDLSFNVYGEY